MIKNKSVLFICKEVFSYPIYFLGNELEKDNNFNYYFIQNTDVIIKNELNASTYFYFKDKKSSNKIYDVKDLNYEFLNNRKNIKIDFNKLKEYEKKYTYFKGLNKQLISSQYTSTPYHDRFYYPFTTYEENLYWLLLNYERTESILDKINPDYIFDLDVDDIQRTIINEVANYKKIPYINIEYSRYKSFIVPTYNLGLKLDEYFIHAYDKNKKEIFYNEYKKEVSVYRENTSIMSDFFKNDITSKYSFSLKDFFKAILEDFYNVIISEIYFLKKNKKINFFNTTPLNSNPIKRLLFWLSRDIKKFYLYSDFNNFFVSPKKEDEYIYLPLHLIPESSTFVKAPMYVNELNLIEAISKLLPINWKLYVKEHQSMIGERSLRFYKNVKKFHNVCLVKPNYYKDPKPWIERSLGVVTITGSSAFEATMLNKPAIVFGNSCFNVLSNIKVANNLNDLETFFKSINSQNLLKDNINDCASYLKTLDEVGVDLNIKQLIKLSGKKIISETLEEEEENTHKELMSQLMNFFKKGVKILENNKQ